MGAPMSLEAQVPIRSDQDLEPGLLGQIQEPSVRYARPPHVGRLSNIEARQDAAQTCRNTFIEQQGPRHTLSGERDHPARRLDEKAWVYLTHDLLGRRAIISVVDDGLRRHAGSTHDSCA